MRETRRSKVPNGSIPASADPIASLAKEAVAGFDSSDLGYAIESDQHAGILQ